MNLELRAFIRSLDDLLTSKDDLLTLIDDKFRKAKIEIAFPQRDLHIRTGLEPLLVQAASSLGADVGAHGQLTSRRRERLSHILSKQESHMQVSHTDPATILDELSTRITAMRDSL